MAGLGRSRPSVGTGDTNHHMGGRTGVRARAWVESWAGEIPVAGGNRSAILVEEGKSAILLPLHRGTGVASRSRSIMDQGKPNKNATSRPGHHE